MSTIKESLAALETDPVLVRLWAELVGLESDEEHAISHEAFKRLDDIRDDLLDVKAKINARLGGLGLPNLWRIHAR